jgi:hypothetical protein
MTVWNPNAPDTLGLEYFALEQGMQQLPEAVTFDSTVTETISYLNGYLASTDSATYLAEIYVAGNEVPGAVTTTIYRPNADVANQANAWLDETLTTTKL